VLPGGNRDQVPQRFDILCRMELIAQMPLRSARPASTKKGASGISAPIFASAATDTTTISFIANAHRSGFPSAPAGNPGHCGLPVA
jgi:hypothetical protein